MTAKKSWTKSFFIGSWNVINFTRRFFFNLLFIFIVVALILAISSTDSEELSVPKNSALVLNLNGDLVIQKQWIDPAEQVINEALGQSEDNPEILVKDVVKVIKNAKEDRRIEALVLSLGGLRSAGFDKLKLVADAIDDFKTSEKPVYAIGDYFGQTQYYLAAHADEIYLNPMGAMIIEGYGRYRMYYKEALEKLKASTHVFKVGKFKSAIEPFIRDDMSEEAKEANLTWMNALWNQYKEDVASARDMDMQNFDETFEDIVSKMSAVEGDFGQYALQNGWVDALKSKHEFRQQMIELLGEDDSESGYASIDFNRYLSIISPPIPKLPSDKDQIAIVVAKGIILDGTRKAGEIGGDSTAALLRKARLDDKVKAVVLQVDSGGGSAFASEVIRNEVDLLKAAGKPVVASMSTLAASGGYWISASADKIIAEPSTITGSIGIYGMLMTYENTLGYLGLNTDGVSTTDIASINVAPTMGLAQGFKDVLQMNIERGYARFIGLVAKERNMTLEQVDAIAQGRVWIGSQALELGLVDALGDLQDAIDAAAELASLSDFVTEYVVQELSPKDQFWQDILKGTAEFIASFDIQRQPSPLLQMVSSVDKELAKYGKLNDPLATYAMCIECELN